jgi:hypothetical protein
MASLASPDGVGQFGDPDGDMHPGYTAFRGDFPWDHPDFGRQPSPTITID